MSIQNDETRNALLREKNFGNLADLVKFTALASAFAILVDAAIGHAMLWGNDPYWTYWITDTLLMATVFGIGTAWFGAGLIQGAIVTAVHMLLLTTYYWSLSPIGLPSQPEWLDLEHTWITGVPVHFAVYYLGYLVAFWLWRQRASRKQLSSPVGREALPALAVSVGVVGVAGLAQTMLVGEFPGVTWFVVRIAVAFPFTLGWWAMAGRGRAAALGGGMALAFVLVTYGHFLAPVGLPNPSWRLFDLDPPPAAVHWLSYRDEFLLLLPVIVVTAIVGYWLASHPDRDFGRRSIGFGLGAVVALVIVGFVISAYTGPQANSAAVRSTGSAYLAQDDGSRQQSNTAVAATLRMTVEDRNTHRTPLPPHDRVSLNATVKTAEGTVYRIDAVEPMVAEPRGRHTTWAGVGFDVWHHGRSGIGDPNLPATKSNVAVYALGNVTADDEPIANGVPVHVMTTSDSRLELHVGDSAFPLHDVPDGKLRVVWAGYEGGHSRANAYARYAWGGTVLLVLLAFVMAAVRRQTR